MSRMQRLWPSIAPLLLVVFGVFAFAPELFFGRAFFGEEQIGFYYAISHYVSQSLHEGVSMLWQSGYYGGVSASLDQFVGAFYPLNLFLFSVLPMFLAHHVSITIATTAGLLFAYWFGRLQGWRRASAFVLALGYFSATTYAWLQIGTIAAHSFALLPAMLVAIHYTQKPGYRRLVAIAGGGAFFAIGLLAGFVQIVFYAYCVAGAYALFVDYEAYDRTKAWWRSFPITLCFVAMTLLGLALGFRQLFPSAYLIDETIRTSTYAAQNAASPLPSELVTFFLPPYLSIPFVGGGHASGFYIGALGLVFAVLALWRYRTRSTVFFAALYALVAFFGFHLPVFGWLNEHLPPFSHMGGNFRWMVGAALPLAYLGAAGVEGFLRERRRVSASAQRAMLWIVGLVPAGLIAGALIAQVVVTTASSPQTISNIIGWYGTQHQLVYTPEHYVPILRQAIAEVGATFSLGNPRFLFGVLCWVVAWSFFAAYRWWPLLRRFAGPGIAAVLLTTAMGTVALQWDETAPQSIYAKTPALVNLLQERESNGHSYRIMGFLLGDGLFAQLGTGRLSPAETTDLQHEQLTNNANLFFNIERMDGMEPYRTLRANRLLDTVVAPATLAWAFDDKSSALATSRLDQLYNRDVQKQVTLSEKLADFSRRLPLISMMNVKYVYSPYQLHDSRLRLVGEVPLKATPRLKLYVYQNEMVLPRLYFARQPMFFAGSQNQLLQHVAAEQNFALHTWIECASCAGSSTLAHAGNGTVTVARYAPGEVQVSATTPTGGWLVFGESALPGWQASVDGTPAPLYTANYLFQAVYVPKGAHQVSFVYQDVAVLELHNLLR